MEPHELKKYAIFEYATQKHFINVYDALRIDRVELELVAYDREAGRHKERAACYLPVQRAKVLCHHVISGSARRLPGWSFEVFSGSERDGRLESRVFKVEHDEGEQGKFSRFPYRLQITIAPGVRTKTGGVSPATGLAPLAQVSARLPADDLLAICLEVRDHLLVFHREMVADRSAAQLENFKARQVVQVAQQARPAMEQASLAHRAAVRPAQARQDGPRAAPAPVADESDLWREPAPQRDAAPAWAVGYQWPKRTYQDYEIPRCPACKGRMQVDQRRPGRWTCWRNAPCKAAGIATWQKIPLSPAPRELAG